MEKITSLFTTIGDILNASSWFQLIQWPFWSLLFILAVCGVYTARFGKKKLTSLAFEGALKLTIIYMIAAAGYVWAPSIMSKLSQLPFFSVSEEALTLVNPLGLLDRWNTALPRVAVRLYMLLFFINVVGVFDYKPANFLSWFFFQIVSGTLSVILYSGFSFSITWFWPGASDVVYKVIAVLLLLCFTIVLALKFFFTFISKGGNAAYQSVYQFLTTQSFGKQFSISALSFLIVVVYLVIAAMAGHNRMLIAAFNPAAFLINGVMCTVTLYIFSRYYNG